jgi:hypothetical protein
MDKYLKRTDPLFYKTLIKSLDQPSGDLLPSRHLPRCLNCFQPDPRSKTLAHLMFQNALNRLLSTRDICIQPTRKQNLILAQFENESFTTKYVHSNDAIADLLIKPRPTVFPLIRRFQNSSSITMTQWRKLWPMSCNPASSRVLPKRPQSNSRCPHY